MIPRFRAWDKDFKTMYEADDIVYIDFEEKQICVKTLFFERASRYDFNDIVLMQSTGLKDKNGKEIFEGDIIAINLEGLETPITAKVFQNRKIGILMFHDFEDNEDVPMVELLEGDSVEFAIIGNIWENPELLEVRT
ncbi:YopX family protein [Streptococcus sp. HSISS2]|uniref:YopX family protein n=1 Tax=Streptococcus sp. HSISS2 TaxID=1316411 RepID=UPI0005B4AA5B